MALALGLLLIAQSSCGWAAPAGESTPEQATYGAGSVLGTLVYSPFKMGFCILGAIASGVTYPVAGAKRAEQVVRTSCRGTSVISHNVLRGRERVEVLGNLSTPESACKQSCRGRVAFGIESRRLL